MSLAIAIVTYRDRKNLENCIQSILKNASELDPQIVVFDNDSRDGTVEMVRTQFPTVELIEGRKNVGFAKGINSCFRKAKSEYVLALDSDTIVTEGAIQALLNFIRQHPGFGVVGARIYYPNGSIQETTREFPGIINALFGRRTLLRTLIPNNPISARYLMRDFEEQGDWFESDWVSAACMLISRKAIQATGGIDEDFFVYWSDADFCFRVRKAGLRVACLPEARIYHCERQNPRTKKSNRMIVDFHRGVYLFYTKNYARSPLNPMRIAAFVALALRAALHLALNAVKPVHRAPEEPPKGGSM